MFELGRNIWPNTYNNIPSVKVAKTAKNIKLNLLNNCLSIFGILYGNYEGLLYPWMLLEIWNGEDYADNKSWKLWYTHKAYNPTSRKPINDITYDPCDVFYTVNIPVSC